MIIDQNIMDSNTLKLLALIFLFGLNSFIILFLFVPISYLLENTVIEKNIGYHTLFFLLVGFVILNIIFMIWGWLAAGVPLVFYSGTNKYFRIYLIGGYYSHVACSCLYSVGAYYSRIK